MAEFYREQRVIGHDRDALVIRVCFERLSDGQSAVAHTEFVREEDHLDKRLAEIAHTTAELLLDAEQPALWDFRPSLVEAISAHDEIFADFVERIKNAEH